MLAIKTENLVKEYKNGVRAIDGLELEVRKEEIFSLLGPNGAGKSSLINILTTRNMPTTGEALIFNKSIRQEPDWVRNQIACVSQKISIDEHLSLVENMNFQSRLYRVDKNIAKERIDMLIESFDLSKYLKYPVSSYSGGVKRRLDVAMSMVSMPKILFLDEPTVGMDIVSRKAMWKVIRKIRDEFKTTVFLTTHYLEEADELSDTICIIKDGRKIIQGSADSLKQYIKQNMLRVNFESKDLAEKYSNMLVAEQICSKVKVRNSYIIISAKNSRDTLVKVNKWLLARKIDFKGLEIVEPSIDDVFIKLTNKEMGIVDGSNEHFMA